MPSRTVVGTTITKKTRKRLAEKLENEIRPLLDLDTMEDGYNCCGCDTYSLILDHAIMIVLGLETHEFEAPDTYPYNRCVALVKRDGQPSECGLERAHPIHREK